MISDQIPDQIFPKSFQDFDRDDTFGYLMALIFEPPESGFASYEIYNFIEETLKVELEDLSVFRNMQGNPIGIVVAQMTEEISLIRLSRITERPFKGKQVSARLFTSQTSFQKFIFAQSQDRLKNIILNYDDSVPLVYVNNFPNKPDEIITEFFLRRGKIKSFKKTKLNFKDNFYFVIEYSNIGEARRACHIYSNFRYEESVLKTALLYKSAAERTFAVHHCQDMQALEDEIGNYGEIDKIKASKDDKTEIYVMMKSIEASKAACLLLNKEFINGVQITTNFIDFEYFNQIV